MKLKNILKYINYTEVRGEANPEIKTVEFDSRKVKPGTLFIAQKGLHTDGHQFILNAFENGAVAIVCEEFPAEFPENSAIIKVSDSMQATGQIASVFYGNPSQKMKVIGITGTNGKTSIATLLFRLFRELGYNAGLISTISYCINETEETASHTTPDAL
ncbi:MAG: Mur ligase domain-containing protein, partial [Bacteroidales bacterium]|nr:Mur ligase domain-containing protein [Bacteroidales bacterium]